MYSGYDTGTEDDGQVLACREWENTGTCSRDSWLSLAETTFGIKPEAAPLFGLCISFLCTFETNSWKALVLAL
jgi:hypothetical protein